MSMNSKKNFPSSAVSVTADDLFCSPLSALCMDVRKGKQCEYKALHSRVS